MKSLCLSVCAASTCSIQDVDATPFVTQGYTQPLNQRASTYLKYSELMHVVRCRCSFSCSRQWAAPVAWGPPKLSALLPSHPLGAVLPDPSPSVCLIAPGIGKPPSWGSLGTWPQHLLRQRLRALPDVAGLVPSPQSGLLGPTMCLPYQQSRQWA